MVLCVRGTRRPGRRRATTDDASTSDRGRMPPRSGCNARSGRQMDITKIHRIDHGRGSLQNPPTVLADSAQSVSCTCDATGRSRPASDCCRLRKQWGRDTTETGNGSYGEFSGRSFPGRFPENAPKPQRFQRNGVGTRKDFANRSPSTAKSPANRNSPWFKTNQDTQNGDDNGHKRAAPSRVWSRRRDTV